MLEPNAGLIELDGKKLKDYAVKESAKKVAVVAQHNYYNFEFSVQEVVMMGRAPHKRTLERDNAEDYRLVHEALKKRNNGRLREPPFCHLYPAANSNGSFWPARLRSRHRA